MRGKCTCKASPEQTRVCPLRHVRAVRTRAPSIQGDRRWSRPDRHLLHLLRWSLRLAWEAAPVSAAQRAMRRRRRVTLAHRHRVPEIWRRCRHVHRAHSCRHRHRHQARHRRTTRPLADWIAPLSSAAWPARARRRRTLAACMIQVKQMRGASLGSRTSRRSRRRTIRSSTPRCRLARPRKASTCLRQVRRRWVRHRRWIAPHWRNASTPKDSYRRRVAADVVAPAGSDADCCYPTIPVPSALQTLLRFPAGLRLSSN